MIYYIDAITAISVVAAISIILLFLTVLHLWVGRGIRFQKVYFQQLFKNSPEGIVILDNEGRIINVNKRFEDIFQYSLNDVKGRYIDDLIVFEKKQAVFEKKQAVNGGTIHSESVKRRKDGSLIDISILEYPVILNGKTLGSYVIYSDVTDRKRAEKQLEYLSLHDPLTKLYNRAYFEQAMQQIEKEDHLSLGVVVCDVDGLKLINDTMGHGAGDSLLVAAARALIKPFSEKDIIARIGGDEFAVLLKDCELSYIESAVNQIRETVTIYNASNPELPLSISIGFSTDRGKSANIVDVFKEADNDMYREKLMHSMSTRGTIVQALIKTLGARDFITEGHAERMQSLVSGLAAAIGIPEHEKNELRLLAQFHDIGKVGIPDRILFKPGLLDQKEIIGMQRHCEIGYRIALTSPQLFPIADWILKHHEWWNGKGYPFGLSGEEIPLQSRILSIADAYDAMTSDRPYRKAMPFQAAVDELTRCAGTQFDPYLVSKFIEMMRGQSS